MCAEYFAKLLKTVLVDGDFLSENFSCAMKVHCSPVNCTLNINCCVTRLSFWCMEMSFLSRFLNSVISMTNTGVVAPLRTLLDKDFLKSD